MRNENKKLPGRTDSEQQSGECSRKLREAFKDLRWVRGYKNQNYHDHSRANADQQFQFTDKCWRPMIDYVPLGNKMAQEKPRRLCLLS